MPVGLSASPSPWLLGLGLRVHFWNGSLQHPEVMADKVILLAQTGLALQEEGDGKRGHSLGTLLAPRITSHPHQARTVWPASPWVPPPSSRTLGTLVATLAIWAGCTGFTPSPPSETQFV